MKIGTRLAILLLTVVSVAHLLRFAFGVELTADGVAIPQWVSLLGCLIPGGIAFLVWRETRGSAHGGASAA